MGVRLLRISRVMDVSGFSRWKVYADVREGLFPPPVKIGARCSAWPEPEVDDVLRARIAGRSEDEIKKIVAGLHAARNAGEVAATGRA